MHVRPTLLHPFTDRLLQGSLDAHPPNGWWETFAKCMRHSHWTVLVWNRTCSTCNTDLLQGKELSFCCNKGWIAPPLPPLPPSLLSALHKVPASRHLSAKSRMLNNLFTFTAIGATQHFYHFERGPASIAITGHTYHCMFDITDTSHSLYWFLYDGAEQQQQGKKYDVPHEWTTAVDAAL